MTSPRIITTFLTANLALKVRSGLAMAVLSETRSILGAPARPATIREISRTQVAMSHQNPSRQVVPQRPTIIQTNLELTIFPLIPRSAGLSKAKERISPEIPGLQLVQGIPVNLCLKL